MAVIPWRFPGGGAAIESASGRKGNGRLKVAARPVWHADDGRVRAHQRNLGRAPRFKGVLIRYAGY